MVGSGSRSLKLKELAIVTEQRKAGIRRGCVAIKMGREEHQERIVVPVSYLNHPLFADLLKEAAAEYGFEQEGAISLPCHLKHFKYVESIIHKEQSLHEHHHHHHRLVGCFRL